MLNRPLSLLVVLLSSAALMACSEEADDGPSPPEEVLPEEPQLTYTEGHLAVEQRGLPFDREDFAAISTGPGTGIVDADWLASEFDLLVLNRPYVDWRVTRCPETQNAPDVQPLATAEALLARARDERGLSFEKVAVNVDLLTPGRRGLLHVCFRDGSFTPRFDVAEHREAILDAFRDLATLDGLAYVTVGLEMNRYYHLQDEAGARLRDDYTNYVTLYREVYAAIKEVAPQVQVGPGLSWDVFMTQTVPELGREYELADPDGLEAAYRAYQRTVAPLLMEGTADFIGWSMIPFTAQPPFQDDPRTTPELGDTATEEEQAAFDARFAELAPYYRWLPIFSGGLPIVVPQADWAVPSETNAGKKDFFLATLKRFLSPVELEWLAWRRLSDIPVRPPEASPCLAYTQGPEPSLQYGDDFCYAGLLSENKQRPVLEIMTADP